MSLPSDLRDEIRARSADIERDRRLPSPIIERLTELGVFRAGVPAVFGGGEVELGSQLEMLESFGRIDASVAWCAMIGAQTSVTSALIAPDDAREIFSAPDVRAGGIFAPNGRAIADGDGFRLSGRWAFGSGVAHSSWFILGAVVFDGDQPRMLGERPDLRFLLLPTDDLDVEDTWYVSGLRGTGSNHVAVNDVFVPEDRTFPLVGAPPFHSGPLYRLPLLSMLALGVASVALGVARGALDDLDELAGKKTPTGMRRQLRERSHIQSERAAAEAELRAGRGLLFEAAAEAWEAAEAGRDPTIEQRASMRLAATHAVRTAAKVVDRAYEAGGGTAIYSESPLQRAFRDVHTITQHMIIGPPTLEVVGRILLGVETDVSQL